MCISEMSFQDFFTNNEDKLNEFAFLFGNGFIKSYPRDAPCCKDVRNSVELDQDGVMKDIWEDVKGKIEMAFKANDLVIQPENFLNYVRRVYSFCVFQKYIERQLKLNASKIKKPREFLKRFQSIYTLNYDYVTYTSIFEEGDMYSILDGFNADQDIDIISIKSRLENNGKKPFRFLHGAFHIFQQSNAKYVKVVRDKNGKFLENIKKKYDDISANMLDPNANPKDNPIIIFSGKSRNKLAMIRSNTYLTHCLEALNNEKKVFTFGCSFELDEHILDAIFKEADGTHKHVEAYIGCFKEDDKKNINQYLKNNEIDQEKIKIVNMSDKDAVNRIVWGNNDTISDG